MKDAKAFIESGKAVLGIELGSTRIKAVLIDQNFVPIASGSHDWENQLVDGLWTYGDDAIWAGLADSYRALKEDVKAKYGIVLTRIGAIGISAMMHGYLAFSGDQLLTPFRTWRNTTTGPAAEELTKLFDFNTPLRWSIAHLYQAILNGEQHVQKIDFLTTLAGYVHWKLTGEKVLGVGDASGMFPIDSDNCDYDQKLIDRFEAHVAGRKLPFSLNDILPRVLAAGENAGTLTAAGAKLLDPSGDLMSGCALCPPEGDAGTGMVATNSIAMRTGNVSAGTSIFAMIVLEKALNKVYTEIDMVTTPSGAPVAMVHCNNCTSDIDAWAGLFYEFTKALGLEAKMGKTLDLLFQKALEGEADGGGLMSYNYVSGEPITGLDEGRPLFMRTPDARFTLANFMRVHLYSAIAALKIGMKILTDERVAIDAITGHGGFFKAKGVGQRLMAAALSTPVSVMETAGEGGAWGIALLAAYLNDRAPGETLDQYLSEKVFASMSSETMAPDADDVKGFEAFMEKYVAALPVEAMAVERY